MKTAHFYLGLTLLWLTFGPALAQENVFLERSYWKDNPSLAQVERDIAAGNNATELNGNMFDAVTYALLEKMDNATIEHLLNMEGNAVDKLTHDGRTYIFWAAYTGNLEMMQYLVDRGAKANMEDSHGYSVLNFAAAGGQTNVALYNFLLEHGADIQGTTNNGANALLLAAPFMEDYGLVQYFQEKGLNPTATDKDGNDLFLYAAKGGKQDFLKQLLAKGRDPKVTNKHGGNAMLLASQGTRNTQNGLETYLFLDSLGVQANVTGARGRNPLHAIAYRSRELPIFEFFISKGVDVNQQDSGGDSPFMNAANSNTLEVVAFLAKYVKDINLQDENGRAALAMAVNRNTPDVVGFLLDNGANVHTTDTKGNTLAHYLLNAYDARNPKNFEEKLRLLQEHGLDLSLPQQKGNTLYHLAVEKNNLSLLERLAAFELDINAKNKEGNTALHLAAMKAQDDRILKYLIAQGADKTAKTSFEESVWDLARENELLTQHGVALEFLK
ncbi:ankyrin repeat domain-containing protein [Maribacter sp. 2307ULW6-5]|uniref:ankyrin repeat domain-containing protein n=1 Tax=Maribacter sp. 2307ULW6-5 TaxID=3386275 RepID=UPI0039BC4FF4